MSQYMAWPTSDGMWHIGTGLTLPAGARLADLDKLLTLRHIDRAVIGFHRPNDETKFNEQFAPATELEPHQAAAVRAEGQARAVGRPLRGAS